ncbi:unnamed protein product [Paramecium pentaurelia]|uniref:Uncharacterized protein n=1 Tax=Paramecium pentaurelia TaxID=43138 RepID=A0A8S1YGD6_9CILI|nr:unnamed protein product [Paramecium pentaurelia]
MHTEVMNQRGNKLKLIHITELKIHVKATCMHQQINELLQKKTKLDMFEQEKQREQHHNMNMQKVQRRIQLSENKAYPRICLLRFKETQMEKMQRAQQQHYPGSYQRAFSTIPLRLM